MSMKCRHHSKQNILSDSLKYIFGLGGRMKAGNLSRQLSSHMMSKVGSREHILRSLLRSNLRHMMIHKFLIAITLKCLSMTCTCYSMTRNIYYSFDRMMLNSFYKISILIHILHSIQYNCQNPDN
jgi:hypothetical protein